MESPDYYTARWRDTRVLRLRLTEDLTSLGWQVVPGIANFLLCHLPDDGPAASDVVAMRQDHSLFLRDAVRMGANLGRHTIRVAVKDSETNRRMFAILKTVINARAGTLSAK